MSWTKALVTVSLGLLLSCAVAAPAAAHAPYTDDDASYLAVTNMVVYPVGKVLEWLVFRPLHAVATVTQGVADTEYRPQRRCSGLRPRRSCSARR